MATSKNDAFGFKQMPKMETTEPSVILKMKKGGHVNLKQASKGEHGHSPMSTAKHRESMEAEEGNSPKKPSMHERKNAMNPNFKGGGKVAHKADGGLMANPQAMAAMANPAIRAAIAKRAMAQRGMARPAMGAPMSAPMSAPMALQPGMKKGGMAKGGDMAQDKAMIKKAFKEHDAQEHKGGKGTHLKLKAGGALQKKAEAFEAKTTIEHDEKPYVTTKMDTAKKDRAHGTGDVKEGKPAGYKHGGHAHKKHHAAGGTITGNAGKYENTMVVDGDHNDSAHGTGGVRMSNAGGFKHGGKAKHHYAHGGTIEHDGNWENRPADTAKPGKVNTKTGEVKESNAGGFKHGGHASKKAYATGGTVNNEGKAVKMPAHFVSRPVANSLQSGTFKKGGQVKKFDDGGSTSDDKYTVSNPKAVSDKASRELEDALNPLSMAKELYSKAKGYFTPPAGSVTKTEKSVTVAPGKKRGGSAMC
jgi:hypothetical protein